MQNPRTKTRIRISLLFLLVAGLLTLAAGQDTSAPASDGASWLFVLNAESGMADEGTLTLTDPTDYVTGFTDRPDRETARIPTEDFVNDFAEAFGDDPPNAALAVTTPDGEHSTIVIELLDAQLQNEAITFTYEVLEGQGVTAIPAELQHPVLFIDPLFCSNGILYAFIPMGAEPVGTC